MVADGGSKTMTIMLGAVVGHVLMLVLLVLSVSEADLAKHVLHSAHLYYPSTGEDISEPDHHYTQPSPPLPPSPPPPHDDVGDDALYLGTTHDRDSDHHHHHHEDLLQNLDPEATKGRRVRRTLPGLPGAGKGEVSQVTQLYSLLALTVFSSFIGYLVYFNVSKEEEEGGGGRFRLLESDYLQSLLQRVALAIAKYSTQPDDENTH
ncbi:hypothetical protein Pcinc_021979 [Petrolisthes cinctipes]|uniref:Transmembrane protein n=1 Tax=Petrolisthes cinctipes TaxID=88211 RepID=A0AAE1FEY1_PETCI|nr:hypothetical protein Pcinc_021979 [Petrolisthes cinctipes]